MKNKMIVKYYKFLIIITLSLLIFTNNSYSSTAKDISKATHKLLENLDFFNPLENPDESDNQYVTQTSHEINSKLKLLENGDANLIFATSVKSIKTIFKSEELNLEKNIIRTLKQTACILVAETSYGDLPNSPIYDTCDEKNIAQIRPPAYKAVYNNCKEQNFSDLSFLGNGTTCETLHPYEMPLCCEAINNDEDKKKCDKTLRNNPLECISKVKRDFLESIDAFPNFRNEPKLNGETNPDPIICKNTSGKEYVYNRVAAIPTHSIFAGLFYLKIRNYKPMTDEKFSTIFGPKEYNGASDSEQRGFKIKLKTCLEILSEPKNSEIIEKAYKNIISEGI